MKRYVLKAGTVVNLPSQGTDIYRPPTEPYAYATESPTGNWVEHSDYAALLETAKLLAGYLLKRVQDGHPPDDVAHINKVMNTAKALLEWREP